MTGKAIPVHHMLFTNHQISNLTTVVATKSKTRQIRKITSKPNTIQEVILGDRKLSVSEDDDTIHALKRTLRFSAQTEK